MTQRGWPSATRTTSAKAGYAAIRQRKDGTMRRMALSLDCCRSLLLVGVQQRDAGAFERGLKIVSRGFRRVEPDVDDVVFTDSGALDAVDVCDGVIGGVTAAPAIEDADWHLDFRELLHRNVGDGLEPE